MLRQNIDETFRQIGQHTDAVDWFVFPGCQPADLGERLRRRGDAGDPDSAWMLYGSVGGPGGTWMWIDYNVFTPPELRCQGFGSAVTYAALQRAHNRGYCTSWIWSSSLGKSVYASLGFVVTDFGVRKYQWKKR